MFTALVKHASPGVSTPLHPLCGRIIDMDLGERIKQLRERFGLTQAELGKLAGVSKSAVSQWERGLTTPERDALMALKRTRMVSPEWVTHGKGDMLDENSYATTDEADLTRAWGLLLPEEQAELLAAIKQRAAHNRAVMENLAPYDANSRTINVSERRLAKAKRLPFFDRRIKKDGTQ